MPTMNLSFSILDSVGVINLYVILFHPSMRLDLAAKQWTIKLTLLSINKYLSTPFSDQQVSPLV